MSMETILLVDDDPSILDISRVYLERDGFRIFCVSTGFQALNSIQSIHPNLIIVNMTLPGLDGIELCKRLRSENNQTPVILLVPDEKAYNRLFQIDVDADDYFIKPFNPRELVARAKSALRRPRIAVSKRLTTLKAGGVSLDENKREVTVENKNISLRLLEYETLHILMKNKGKTISGEQLLREGWGFSFPGQMEAIDVILERVSQKLNNGKISIKKSDEGYQLLDQ